jgi:hypothetical protein
MLEPARTAGAGFGLPPAVTFLFFPLMLESLSFCGALEKLAPGLEQIWSLKLAGY